MSDGSDNTAKPTGVADELNETDLDKVTGGAVASRLPGKKKPPTSADPEEGGEVF